MRTDIAAFIDHPIGDARRSSAERRQGITHRGARLINRHECRPVNRQPKRFRHLDRDHALMTAVFTQMTDGKPSAISRQVAPSSIDPNNFPLRVPK